MINHVTTCYLLLLVLWCCFSLPFSMVYFPFRVVPCHFHFKSSKSKSATARQRPSQMPGPPLPPGTLDTEIRQKIDVECGHVEHLDLWFLLKFTIQQLSFIEVASLSTTVFLPCLPTFVLCRVRPGKCQATQVEPVGGLKEIRNREHLERRVQSDCMFWKTLMFLLNCWIWMVRKFSSFRYVCPPDVPDVPAERSELGVASMIFHAFIHVTWGRKKRHKSSKERVPKSLWGESRMQEFKIISIHCWSCQLLLIPVEHALWGASHSTSTKSKVQGRERICNMLFTESKWFLTTYSRTAK